jgi:O-6-methylguanine DNA methyltransferase
MGSGPPDPLRETVTYGELNRNLGDGTTAQEVGAAVGRNRVCILIPCHRVVGAGGKLTGFAGGLGRKRFSSRYGTGRGSTPHSTTPRDDGRDAEPGSRRGGHPSARPERG